MATTRRATSRAGGSATGEIRFGYDALNRLTLTDLPVGDIDRDITTTYDLLGRLLSATDAIGHVRERIGTMRWAARRRGAARGRPRRWRTTWPAGGRG